MYVATVCCVKKLKERVNKFEQKLAKKKMYFAMNVNGFKEALNLSPPQNHQGVPKIFFSQF